MCEFSLTFEEFAKMFDINAERTFEVTKIIELVSAIKKSKFLEEKKIKFNKLNEKLEIYYKKYNINAVEKLKDDVFLKKIKRDYIENHKHTEIEHAWEALQNK